MSLFLKKTTHKQTFEMIFLILFTLLCICNCNGENVLGCGGFVKSDVDINFSLVEVKLYTPHGSIKYQTDCAPNTGYYLIPLYDKGDYILKAEPPKGWGFEPASVELKVDGETDPCSKGEDINFKFTGFSLTGAVISSGQTTGPAGVQFNLLSSSNPEISRSTVSNEQGSFSFSNVLPGEYKVVAKHSVWKFSTSEVAVQVKSDNAVLSSNLVISGYDVKGEVSSDGQSIKGVNFVVFSKNSKTPTASDCEKGAPKGFVSKDAKATALCYVTSHDDGIFTFPSLPTGSYFLVPFYKDDFITFDVVPDRLDFDVQHTSLTLQSKFEVSGFSVSGKVLDKENGIGIANVAVIINGKEEARSREDGSYQLENMKTGNYRLSAHIDNVAFQEMAVTINPRTPQLPNLVASGFNMCGRIRIDRVPESLGTLTQQRRIIYYPVGKGSDAVSKKTDASGQFCEMVKPGEYVVKVHMSEEESKAGLSIVPGQRHVTVSNSPVLDVDFSQFRARITGKAVCMEKCPEMEVALDGVGRNDKQIRTKTTGDGNEVTFTLENILPGKYKASIIHDNWCWKERSTEVEIHEADVTGLEFTHTGYILKCSVSHPITMNFAHIKKEKNVGSFLLDRGLNRFCLASPGVYQLTPESCHKFERDNYTYSTSTPVTLTLTAVQHLVTGTITSNVAVNDIFVTISSSVEDVPIKIGPLVASSSDKKTDKETIYNFSHWTRSGETLTVSAQSAEVLFYPPQMDAFISGEECPGNVVTLVGKRGVFISGSITPELEGVQVVVAGEHGTVEPIHLLTDKTGKYRVGPLHSENKYSVVAEKEGYVLSALEKDVHSFRAFKLGELSIQMLDEAGLPLSGVLLSLSGEKQYRSNNVTAQDGLMVFKGLSPGKYFLRPMLKEYKFEPSSQLINVQEGTTKTLNIKGSRVAFSCFGRVSSLNGEAEPGVIVEALGTGDCLHQEESKTELDGSYRIRGLQPKCKYDVHLKTGEVNTHIERTAPSSRLVLVEYSDLHDVNIIAFRRINQMDISGNIKTDLKFLSTLKVKLVLDSQPDTPIQIISLTKSTWFFLPSLAIDDKKYSLILVSSLSQKEFDYYLPSVEFTANSSHKHFTFEFYPRAKTIDQVVSQGSYLALPLVALVCLAVYNYKALLPHALNIYQQLQTMKVSIPQQTASSSSATAAPTAVDTSIPEEFLSMEASPARKKARPRKTH